jgi:flagellar basal body-associated protein FliL
LKNNALEESIMNSSRPKKTSKQIFAIICIILMVLLALTALLAAIFDQSASGWVFRSALAASLSMPFLIWIYSWLYQKFKNRK